MPRRLFKRYLPDPQSLKRNPSLRFLGARIHDPNLWHLNRHSVARAAAIGLFWAIIPMPLQMLPASLCALFLRANLPLSIALVWLTNPLTMPPVVYASYKLGAWTLGSPALQWPEQVNMAWLGQLLENHWQPLLLGSLLLACLLSLLGYLLVHGYWLWWVRRNWRRRQQARKQKAG